MTLKILLVDDDPDIIDLSKRILADYYTVITALSGAEALEKMRAHPDVSVVVSDENMPGMSGLVFLQKAARLNPRAILMMLTACKDRQTVDHAVSDCHTFQFLTKPCSPQELIKAVGQSVELWRLEENLDRIKAASTAKA